MDSGGGGLALGIKLQEREADRSHLTSAEVKKTLIHASISP
jgi:hypothetical protein